MKVGDIVETAVFVGKERRPTGRGRVLAIHSGYYDVDICYPYAEPWIVSFADGALMVIKVINE